MNSTAIRHSVSGNYTTSRRGAVDHAAVWRLHERGIGAQNIAAMLGACMEDVRRVLAPEPTKELQPKPPEGPRDLLSERDERFRTMWLAGVPNAEIMAALMIGAQTVCNTRDRLGLKKRGNGGRRARWQLDFAA